MITREDALKLVQKYNREPFHIRHALTVEAVMRWYAHDLGFGDQLSPQTAAALPEAVARVVALVETEQARC